MNPLLLSLYDVEDVGTAADDGIDLIIAQIDDWCYASRWDLIDEILDEADVDRLNSCYMVSLLAFTLCVKSRLRSRSSYYDRVRKRLTELRGAEATRKLLQNLA